MRISHFLLAVGLSFGLMIPVSAMAQPVPKECRKGNGDIKCNKPGCQKFCKGGHHGKGHGKHAKPVPHHHAKPVPHHHVKPVPPPSPAYRPAPHRPAPPPPPHVKRRMHLENEINALVAQNNRLARERNEAIREADHAYAMCLRMHPAIRIRCTRPMDRVDSIDSQMRRNSNEIDRLKYELRRL